MTLINTDTLRKVEVKGLATRYIEKVFTLGKPKKSFSQVGEEFLYWCQFGREKPIAHTTFDTYKKGLDLILKHFGDISVSDLTLDHVINLKKDFIDRGASLGYLHKILMLTRLILRYALEELQLNVLAPDRIKLPPKPNRDVVYWSQSEIDQIFASIPKDTLYGVRLRAVLTTILDTGMRIAEVCSLNRDTIDWGDKSAYVIGKGSKKRKVLFRDWSLWWIRQYLNLRKDEHIALFVTHQSGYPIERISPDDVRRVMRRIGHKLGLKTLRPHIGRKTAGSLMWNNGADIQDVQVFLGHERLQTTQIYVGKNYERVRETQSRTMQYRAEDTGTQVVLQWSKEHAKCLNCGLTDKPHAGRGYCYNCYMNIKNAQKRLEKAGENGA